jgi:hypothetical protein
MGYLYNSTALADLDRMEQFDPLKGFESDKVFHVE